MDAETLSSLIALFAFGLYLTFIFKRKYVLAPISPSYVKTPNLDTIKPVGMLPVSLGVLWVTTVRYSGLIYTNEAFAICTSLVLLVSLCYIYLSDHTYIFYQSKKYIKFGLLILPLLLFVHFLSAILSITALTFIGKTPAISGVVGAVRTLAQGSPSYLMFMFASSLIAPIYEEIIFKGFIQNFFYRFFTPITSILLASLLFALGHCELDRGIENLTLFLPPLTISLALGWIYFRTKSIFPCFAYHIFGNSLAFIASTLVEPLIDA